MNHWPARCALIRGNPEVEFLITSRKKREGERGERTRKGGVEEFESYYELVSLLSTMVVSKFSSAYHWYILKYI